MLENRKLAGYRLLVTNKPTTMKSTLLKSILILTLASSAAIASDKEAKDTKGTKASTSTAAKEKAKTKETAPPKKQEVTLTGSHIQRAVRRDGVVNDAPNSLTIIDSKAIERSGAADVRQLLARQSALR